jgi:phage terminase large subunit-like protein
MMPRGQGKSPLVASLGLDPTLTILDEIGVISRDVYEVVALAQGKREESTLLGIGTPGPDPFNNVLADMRTYAAEHPDDTSFVWREFSAADFTHHPVDCPHRWELANPAIDDFLHRDALTALLPPKTREATFRGARLCQFVTDTDGAFLPPGCWEALSAGTTVADGAEVVIALDGSFSDDTTALLLATVATDPHFDTLAVWEPSAGERVPVADVEQAIRDACRRFKVADIIADPFRWPRTLQALESEGLPLESEGMPVVEFPHGPSRLPPRANGLFSAAVNRKLTHSGEAKLAARADVLGGGHHVDQVDLSCGRLKEMQHDRAEHRKDRRDRRHPPRGNCACQGGYWDGRTQRPRRPFRLRAELPLFSAVARMAHTPGETTNQSTQQPKGRR